MKYTEIDSTLNAWAKRHGLFWATRSPYDEDAELRSTEIVDDTGDRYQLGVGSPESDGIVSIWIHINPNMKSKATDQNKRQTYKVQIPELDDTLEKAYAHVLSWIHQNGKTRTPII